MSGSYFMLQFLKEERLKAQQQNLNKRRPSTGRNTSENANSDDDNKCRICLKEATISIYHTNPKLNIKESIRTFAGIEINETDDHPKHVCKSCYNFLQNATLFRKLAQDTDKFLRQLSSHNSDVDLDNGTDDKTSNDDLRSLSYTCKLCKINFATFNELVAHKNSNVHKKVRVQCPVCFRLLTAHLYKRHLARHQSASHLICEVCGKLYRKDNLVRHLQLHSFELPYQCQECPYRGRFMESLKIHMRSHTGDKPFSCSKCELRFLTRSNLNRHLLTHNKERPFKCVECGRGFYTKRDMDVHLKADHAGMKEFCCRVCGNKYSTRKALMRHELRVHKRDKMAKGRMPLYLQAEYQKSTENT